MSGFITIALIFLVFIIIYQIAKASEYATVIRGEEKVKVQTNRTIAWLLVIFFVLGMYGIYKCHMALVDKMLPPAASLQGAEYDKMFNSQWCPNAKENYTFTIAEIHLSLTYTR